jgi:Lrp/AsnC family leucine-responsive transcriptional regulator
MDDIDLKIIKELTANGRITWSELAGNLSLSAPAIADRVKKLEEKGIIRGYTAIIDPEAVGLSIMAFIFVTINDYKKKEDFINLINGLDEVQECHHIAGNEDFLLKVRCRCISNLDKLICEKLKGLDIVARTMTNVVLSTDKERAQPAVI